MGNTAILSLFELQCTYILDGNEAYFTRIWRSLEN